MDDLRIGRLLRADSSLPPRLTGRGWAFDVAVALGVLLYELDRTGPYRRAGRLGHGLFVPNVPHLLPLVPIVIMIVLSTALLAARRLVPLTVFAVVVACWLAYHLGGGVEPSFAVVPAVIAGYSAALYSPYRVPALGAVAATCVAVASGLLGSLPHIQTAFVPLLVVVPAGVAFNMLNTARQRAEVSRERLHAVEAQQQAATRLAVEQERSRLAGELHDVVTHNVGMMVIQAGAARMVMATAPDQARDALLAVEESGRAAMSELRHAMGLLSPDGDGDLAPRPDLSRVPALVDRVRDAGVAVELAVTGTPVQLVPGAGLAGYRVVQEALTNVVKHARGASVRVAIEHARGQVTIEVTDTGGTPDSAPGTGRGLAGLRERLQVYGGTLDAGPTAGGFRVHAVIPTGAPS